MSTMSTLYLTPASIGYLTQFILGSSIAGYLLYLSRKSWQRDTRDLPTALLAGAFAAFATTTLMLFLNASLYPDSGLYAMPLESVAVAIFLTLLLQFAYCFPSLAPSQKREAWIALGLTILAVFQEAAFATQRYILLTQGVVRYRPPVADLPLAAAFLWVAVVFLRQTARVSTGNRQASMWRKLRRPQGRPARAARALALLSIMALGFEVVDILRSYLILPAGTTDLVQSLGILFTLSAFALVYLSYFPATTSVLAKLVGISLATILAMLGSVGWIVGPTHIAAYHNDNFITPQTLRFLPNRRGGYSVAVVPFRFENDLGEKVSRDEPVPNTLATAFSFYSQTWRQVYLDESGAVSFGQALEWQGVKLRYGPSPAIFPLAVKLKPDGSPRSGLYVKNVADKLLVTWNHLAAVRERDAHYTFQMALYPTGVFEITYDELPARQEYDIYDPRATPWLIGAVPGTTDLRPNSVHFAADLPFTGGPRGMVEDFYLDFRRYLHQLLLPVAYLIIGSSLFIVMGFPIFFRLNLVRPLNSLLEGVRQVNAGNLAVTVPVQFHDEIGFLTQSFNDMVTALQTQSLALHRRAAEMETLVSVSSALRQAVTSEEMVSVLIEGTVKALGAEAGTILLLEEGELIVAAFHGVPESLLGYRLSPSNIPCWSMLRAGQLVQTAPVEQEECAACNLCRPLATGQRVVAVVPLQTADSTLGLLQIAFDSPNSLSEDHRRMLMAIAEMGNNALQRVRTMEMLEQLVQGRTRELTTLYEVTRTVTQQLDLQSALEDVLVKALEAIGGQTGFIHLVDRDGKTLRLAAQRSAPPATDRSTEPLSSTTSRSTAGDRPEPVQPDMELQRLLGQVLKRNKIVVQSPQALETYGVASEESLAYIGVPIRTKGHTLLGVISICGEAGQDFSVEDIALLSGIADHVGVAVESAQSHRRAEEAAAQEERRRLARDLHDSVTQSLHSLVLSADTAHHLIGQGRLEALDASLRRLVESARQSLKEMRLLLYELRLAPLEQMDLVDVLQTRLEAVEQRAGIEADLVVDGPADWPRTWEGDLYCIAMEALNNTLRHARATQVSVHLRGDRRRAVLEVADNGRGFDPQQKRAAGMGLRSMAERAQRLGGQLTIDSSPGEGTRIRFRVSAEGAGSRG